jgi:predicted ATPase
VAVEIPRVKPPTSPTGVRSVAKPPPIPERPRSYVRIDTDPEPVRVVRSQMVGRDNALSTARDIITRAVEFQAPQLITLVGNQGTGKTRLINELINELAASSFRVFHGAAERDVNGKPVKLAAIASLLRDRFELTPDPDEASRLRFAHEVKSVMASDQTAEMLHVLGALLGMEFAPTPFLRAVAENPKMHDEIQRTALRRFIELDAAQSPLVLVLDDMQWADPDTLAQVNDLVASLGGSPVVLLAAARP